MAKVRIIKEDSVQRLKDFMLENIERLDAECVIFEAESDQEKSHRQSQQVIDAKNLRYRDCYTEREIYHSCLCQIQMNITEIEL